MKVKTPKRIGLAIVGAGRVGLMRGEIAARFPQLDRIGIAEIDPARGKLVADRLGADFLPAIIANFSDSAIYASLVNWVLPVSGCPTIVQTHPNPAR